LRRFLRIGIVFVALICLIGGGLFLVKNKKKELAQTPAYGTQPRPVTVILAEKGDLSLQKQYLAVVEPALQAQVSARVTAELITIKVDEGDRVKAGTVLAELDAKEIEHSIDAILSRIDQTQAELAGNQATVKALQESHTYWQAEKERDLTLADKGAISRSQAQQTADKASDLWGKLRASREKSVAIEKQIEALKNQKAELVSRRGYYTLTSPFAGVVTQRLADPGDMATPSKTLITVQDQSGLKLVFDLPQKDLPQVNTGQAAVFKVNSSTRQVQISLLEPALNTAKMMRAEVRLDQEAANGLTSGAYVPVHVILKRLTDVILLPASSVIEGPQGKIHVFAVTEGKLSAEPISVLGRSGDRVAVKGIDVGMQVVKNTYLGWATLSAGQKVEAIR